MKPIKIFVDCHVFDGNLQGITTYLKGLYQELIKDKDKTFFLAAYNIENLKSVFGIHDNVIYLKYSFHNKFFRLLFDIPRLITVNSIDYAHFQYVVPPIKKCRYIVTLHDVLFLDYPGYFPLIYKISKKTLYKLSAKYSDVVLTVSEYSKQRIQHHFKINSVFITPNAVDPIFYEEYDKQKAQEIAKLKFDIKNYFLFVSRWEPRKNHHLLLKVFVEYKYYEKYNLVFVGDDAIENKEYNTYFNNLSEGIKSKIFKYQKVSFQDLVIIIRGASLSVYPSIAEGFGIPPLESLAANIPTICSNTTAMSDFQFFNDCLFNPLETEDLKNKIDIGLNDKKITQKKEAMKTMFNWKIASESFKKAIS